MGGWGGGGGGTKALICVYMWGGLRNECVYWFPINNTLQDLESILYVFPPKLPCKSRVGNNLDEICANSCKFHIILSKTYSRIILPQYCQESCQILSSFIHHF